MRGKNNLQSKWEEKSEDDGAKILIGVGSKMTLSGRSPGNKTAEISVRSEHGITLFFLGGNWDLHPRSHVCLIKHLPL